MFMFAQPSAYDRNISIFKHRFLDKIKDVADYVPTSLLASYQSTDQPQLLQIVHARYALCLGLGFGKSRKEHASQNGDNRNDHQQFDEGEGSRFLSGVGRFHEGSE